MTKNVRVDGGTVVEIIPFPPEGFSLEECFQPEFLASVVTAPDNVEIGWTYDGKKFVSPTSALVTTEDLLSHAASKRHAVETGGITVGSVPVATDRESQSLITGAYVYVRNAPDAVVQFKTASGFVELTAVQVEGIATAVAAHVQACFAPESDVSTKITSGTIKSIAAIDANSWRSMAGSQ